MSVVVHVILVETGNAEVVLLLCVLCFMGRLNVIYIKRV